MRPEVFSASCSSKGQRQESRTLLLPRPTIRKPRPLRAEARDESDTSSQTDDGGCFTDHQNYEPLIGRDPIGSVGSTVFPGHVQCLQLSV
jgi:hypothetical protein